MQADGITANNLSARAWAYPLRCFKNVQEPLPPTPACDTPDITLSDGTTTYTLQACNLGASVAGTGSASFGTHFQRGNGYGFANNETLTTSDTQVDTSSY
jgi:hypothetical protein